MAITAHRHGDDLHKPALVLVHGLGSAATIWKSLLSQLSQHFTVYAVDLPGHGVAPLSQDEKYDPISLAKGIVEEMERAHGVKQMHVAGNSLGGWIALEMGAVAPDRIQSITALAPAGLWHEVPERRLPPSIDARILAKISRYFMPIAYRLPPLKALGYKKITHLWRELSYESCRDSVVAMAHSRGYTPIWNGARGRKFESDVPAHINTSIVFGDYDLMLPEDVAQEKTVAPAHSNWVVVDNCAHVIMWNYPELTVDFIRRTAKLSR